MSYTSSDLSSLHNENCRHLININYPFKKLNHLYSTYCILPYLQRSLTYLKKIKFEIKLLYFDNWAILQK